MKTTKTILAGLLTSSLLIACQNNSSDPLQDYQGLKGSTPTTEKPSIQTLASDKSEHYFSLNVVGSEAMTFVNMDQGQTSEVQLLVTIHNPGITGEELRLVDFPLADGPVLIKTDTPHVYSLKWHPEMGVVPKGETSVDFVARFQVLATEPANTDLSKIASTFSILIQVKGNSSQPSLKDQSQLDAIEEGVAKSFTVTVEDPGSAFDEVSKPELIISSYLSSNTEAYRANGAPYVYQDGIERVSKTQWKFTHTILAEHLPLDRDRRGIEIPKSNTVPVCFYLRAIGVTGKQSGQRLVCVTAKRAAQPAAPSGGRL